jgi:RNA binding exosome subunit
MICRVLLDGMMTQSPAPDSEHIREALEEVTDPNARYHLRMALQYVVAAETDVKSSP